MVRYPSFTRLNTLIYFITFSLSIHLSMDIQVITISWLPWIILQWTLGYTCLFQFWFLQCVCPTVGLLGHMAILSHVWLFATPWTSPWNSPGQNTGVGSLSLLQGIFPAQGLNPSLLHCGQILYQLSYQGSPNPKERQWQRMLKLLHNCTQLTC